MILNALGDAFDLICIDAYSGNWNAARGEFTPPEKAFRKLLLLFIFSNGKIRWFRFAFFFCIPVEKYREIL